MPSTNHNSMRLYLDPIGGIFRSRGSSKRPSTPFTLNQVDRGRYVMARCENRVAQFHRGEKGYVLVYYSKAEGKIVRKTLQRWDILMDVLPSSRDWVNIEGIPVEVLHRWAKCFKPLAECLGL
jgi:hypothetical protein